ncbi:hypothetical protein NKH77_25720 [Streptomyces sp. M19]
MGGGRYRGPGDRDRRAVLGREPRDRAGLPAAGADRPARRGQPPRLPGTGRADRRHARPGRGAPRRTAARRRARRAQPDRPRDPRRAGALLGALGIQIQAARALLTDHHDSERAADVLAGAQRLAADGLVETRRAVHALRADTAPSTRNSPTWPTRTGGAMVRPYGSWSTANPCHYPRTTLLARPHGPGVPDQRGETRSRPARGHHASLRG